MNFPSNPNPIMDEYKRRWCNRMAIRMFKDMWDEMGVDYSHLEEKDDE